MTSSTTSILSAMGVRKPQVDFSNPSPLVTITVGSGSRAKHFSIHQEVISFYSPYFREYFKPGHLKADLPGVDVQVFGLLSHWLYTQEIRLRQPSPTEPSKNVVGTHLLPLTKLWSLAKYFGMPGLQNTIMDRIAPILDLINISDVAKFVIHNYEQTETEGTPIRALALHHAAHNMTPEVLKDIGKSAPPDLLFDISLAFLEHNDLVHNSDRYEVVDPTKFHVGIPEVEDEFLDDETSDVECEVAEEEEEDESVLFEHFGDESNEISEYMTEMAEPCEEEFEEADESEEEDGEETVEDLSDMAGLFD
ncbi:hypothetical protein ONS95_005163 [Cadophora gregata]|uniref:uncharacterized protein n=1 Tax=Cadophora gregata TaxID=51156 RepID=UPI0026DC57A6|nr:uncharacterized protein ONS95_005163 [Cadophora gregata]KAK0104898.1 hypothetical protein ONS95_005163 [Cadophora gregata]KAK0115023.1 hypothetical protein ONS96_013493 [Cadophora gregata f. sp. sojae]